MDLTREEAVRLFHKQWSDMQKNLGDIPTADDRLKYKRRWCALHKRFALNSCFLCKYVQQEMTRHGIVSSLLYCHMCPIAWPTGNGTCCSSIMPDGFNFIIDYYLAAPIRSVRFWPCRKGRQSSDGSKMEVKTDDRRINQQTGGN